MKSKLAVGLNVYQNTPGVLKCIDSLYDHVDLIIVVDGKHDCGGSPSDDCPLSTDGLITELFHNGRYGNPHSKIIVLQLPNESQPAKRTRYLQVAGKHRCTHLLVIGADEYVHPTTADWSLFRDQLDNHPRFERGLQMQGNTPAQYTHNISYQAQPNNPISLARLIYRPGDLEYGSHWLLYRKRDGSPTVYQNVADPNVVRGIKIATDEHLTRSEARLQQDASYQFINDPTDLLARFRWYWPEWERYQAKATL